MRKYFDRNVYENFCKEVDFNEKLYSLIFFSLPEVPSLADVANIEVTFSDDLREQLGSLLVSEGQIHERAPVQIVEIEERPGGLLLKWEEVNKLAVRKP